MLGEHSSDYMIFGQLFLVSWTYVDLVLRDNVRNGLSFQNFLGYFFNGGFGRHRGRYWYAPLLSPHPLDGDLYPAEVLNLIS